MADGPLVGVLRYLRGAARPPGDGLADAELLERFLRRHDEAAFEALVWRHAPLVWGVCRRLVRHEQDAEDAFQATFLALVRKGRAVARGGALAAWLHRVAYRAALAARAAAARHPAAGEEAMHGLGVGPPDEAEWRDLRPVLDEEVDRLPGRYRTPFVLCYLEGKTNAEAARQLGCPEGTVASRLAWARRRLRVRLSRRGVSLPAGLLAGAPAPHAGAAVPAGLVGAIVRAGARAATGGAAGPAVTTLTEGVLRAMWLTRLRTAAVLLALAAAGAGALAYYGGGEEQTDTRKQAKANASGGPAGPKAAEELPEAGAASPPAAEQLREEKLAQTQKQLRELEVYAEERERRWEDDLVAARKELIVAEERLKLTERQHAARREKEKAELTTAEANRLPPLRKELDRLTAIAKNIASTSGRGDKDPGIEPIERQKKKLLAELEKGHSELRQLEQQLLDVEQQRTDELITARLHVATAEERLRRVERQQAAQRDRLQARLEAADERLRQLEGDAPAAAPADRRGRALEGKVDRLLREVEELRREMRRGTPDRPRGDP